MRLIKFWFRSYPVSETYGTELLHIGLSEVEKYLDGDEIFVNQKKRHKEIKIFLECLKREIEDDFGCWDDDRKKYIDYRNSKESFDLMRLKKKENAEMLEKYFKKRIGWWI